MSSVKEHSKILPRGVRGEGPLGSWSMGLVEKKDKGYEQNFRVQGQQRTKNQGDHRRKRVYQTVGRKEGNLIGINQNDGLIGPQNLLR